LLNIPALIHELPRRLLFSKTRIRPVAPVSNRTWAKQHPRGPKKNLYSHERRRRAEALYELETGFREEGWASEEFVYDEKHDLYRFPDGEFAFSREYANERRLREMGIIG
jgi:hypothetical protein